MPQGVGGRDDGVDMPSSLGAARGRQRLEVFACHGLRRGGSREHLGLFEDVEDDVTGEVGDILLASLGGGDEAIEPTPTRRRGEVLQLRVVREAPVEDCRDRRGHLGDPLEGAEHPHRGGLEGLGAREVGDAVAAEGALEPLAVALRQTRLVGVEPLEIGQEVLLGVDIAVAVEGLGLGAGPVEGSEVGEEVEQLALGLEQVGVIGGELGGQRRLPFEQGFEGLRVAVVAEEVVAQARVDPAGVLARGRAVGGRESAQVDRRGPLPRAGRGRLGTELEVLGGPVVVGSLDPQEGRTALDLGVTRDRERRHESVERGRYGGNHLHRLEDGQRLPGDDVLARSDEQ